MSALFVAATGTDIGKTFVACGIIAELRRRGRKVEALKPLVSGYDDSRADESDPGRLLTALGRDVDPSEIERISPWRYRAPLAPDMAARREGKNVDFGAVVKFCRDAMGKQGDLLIEGVGGVMAPIAEGRTVLDWIEELGIPVLLVAGSYLGAQSHSLTALAALRERRISPIALVVCESSAEGSVDPAETAASLQRFTPGIEILVLPRQKKSNESHAVFARLADGLAGGFELWATARA
jgi:dethiobiotin synthetase